MKSNLKSYASLPWCQTRAGMTRRDLTLWCRRLVCALPMPGLQHARIHTYTHIIRVCGLTAGPGEEAYACMLLNIPYTGVCLTEAHKEALYEHLAGLVFNGFRTEGSPFYDAELAVALEEAGLANLEVADKGAGGEAKPATKPPKSCGSRASGSKAVANEGEEDAAKAKKQALAKAKAPAKAKANLKPKKLTAQEQMKQALAALQGGRSPPPS